MFLFGWPLLIGREGKAWNACWRMEREEKVGSSLEKLGSENKLARFSAAFWCHFLNLYSVVIKPIKRKTFPKYPTVEDLNEVPASRLSEINFSFKEFWAM